MPQLSRAQIQNWTIDYGNGRSEAVHVPHAWRQDVPVEFEGPVTYRTSMRVPEGNPHLLFHGVSYLATVRVNGKLVATHRGIWDAFAAPLQDWAGQEVEVEVEVVKNGGKTFPVKDVASGFLPFLHHTFGGIFGNVELVDGEPRLDFGAVASRVQVDGAKIFVDGKPWYMRGLLHWGWYPEVGHPNPPEDAIRKEVRDAKSLGFNLVKFCLWVPSHRYVEILAEEEMEAWFELPLWDPSSDPDRQREIAEEFERIVRQYRHHANIVVWTVGCELSTSTPAEYRQRLTDLVRELTGCPLVKDNSGGAEMYGGDLREFGDFYDFHPYCDTPFYPGVLDSLLPGPRPSLPILLGEYNDIDIHRDMPRTLAESPYWASTDPDLNAQGVRWQYDLPGVLRGSRFAHDPVGANQDGLAESSRKKALFIRKSVHEWVRARSPISGYVVTGYRDTPISTSGFFDDWGNFRFSVEECAPWNGTDVLFLIPTRRPPWVHGGNRPGMLDPHHFFPGQVFLKVGLHSEFGGVFELEWEISSSVDGTVAARGSTKPQAVEALLATQLVEIHWNASEAGDYVLKVTARCPDRVSTNEWPIWIVESQPKPIEDWKTYDPAGLLPELEATGGDGLIATRIPPDLKERLDRGEKVLLFLLDEGSIPAPFWRESAFEFLKDAFWDRIPFQEQWDRFLPISGDRVIDVEWLRQWGEPTVLMNRVDVRTYADAPVLAKVGSLTVTTLRPFGGLGIQPTSLAKNPAGWCFLRALTENA